MLPPLRPQASPGEWRLLLAALYSACRDVLPASAGGSEKTCLAQASGRNGVRVSMCGSAVSELMPICGTKSACGALDRTMLFLRLANHTSVHSCILRPPSCDHLSEPSCTVNPSQPAPRWPTDSVRKGRTHTGKKCEHGSESCEKALTAPLYVISVAYERKPMCMNCYSHDVETSTYSSDPTAK